MASTDDIFLEPAELECYPPGQGGCNVATYDMAEALVDRFQKEREIDDLNEAITLHRATLELQQIGNHKRSSTLNDLAVCLSMRYDNQGVIADLEEAVTLGRAALELRPPGHLDRGASLFNLAGNLRKRFQKQADPHSLDEAIELLRAALELRPPGHPDRSESLHSLAVCLSMRCDNQGVIADLEEAVTLGRAALVLRPPGHLDRGASLSNLAGDLRKRFQKQAKLYCLDEAIELLHGALELRPPGHPDRSESLHSLAVCLSDRYDNQEVVADLEEAVALGRAALELRPPTHPDCGVSLYNLAYNLRKRFQKQADLDDLDEAVALLRAALELRSFGHPDRSELLHTLAVCLSDRYDNQGVVADLEETVTLGRAALELRPPGHPERDVSLYTLARGLWAKFQKQPDMTGLPSTNSHHQTVLVDRPTSKADLASLLFELSLHLWDRFQRQATTIDLDEIISLVLYALELRLPRNSQHDGAWVQRLAQKADSDELVMLGRAVDNLGALANYFISEREHATVDLKEAITLCRIVLQFRPTGHPSRASSLHILAQCLADRFRQQLAAAGLDEAIALEQEALQLFTPEDPGYNISRRCLTTYLQMKIRSGVAVASPNASLVTQFGVQQVIRDVAFETLKTMPTRLLHTHTGALCDQETQISHFMRSQQYKQLLSLCTTCNPAQRMELIHTVLSRYFQFVMLSHRWGEAEPSFRDIEGRPIYDLPAKGGFRKLQAFSAVACERDYLWAWSDTCCIDRGNSAELEDAIGSMFAWYRRSALTIVYLSDVPDTGSFESSEWFTRGWTLLELLAPKHIQFYTQTWSPYKNLTSSNHKTDDSVLQELERATGIESEFLTNFSPGMDDARWKLQWASQRRTTRPEDIAYSLFGIFDLHLPVLYGEPAENALGRLLAEIISRSGDISVLDWVGESSPYHSCFPVDITSYRMLPLPPPQTNVEGESAMNQQPTSFEVLRKLRGSLTTSALPQFVSRSLTSSNIGHRVSAARLRTPGLYAPNEAYDFHSLTRVPPPRFLNGRLILPCIAHRVTVVQLKRADPSAPRYTYKIHASGLRPLEIALPDKLENQVRLQGAPQLVRPWHSKLLGPSANLDTVTEEQLVSILERPFNALLLIPLPHNEYKRIASSILFTAQPTNRASILKSKVRIFNIV
ncbi:hypothetical protein F5J12DRAFT_166510 [Pisolithus orientalis]|uniref:uncharacterized protein n=1 Tax=Pisolithus orientalis TaxID=936130 RepID=UPI00222554A6|nr:uncharacterized protein F5J12DRAFT_166510 [Pisolithus orientalis]KAI6003213.1 hypothetical protein F5J12DRAFT_166510 [Pisolithus orientalis]